MDRPVDAARPTSKVVRLPRVNSRAQRNIATAIPEALQPNTCHPASQTPPEPKLAVETTEPPAKIPAVEPASPKKDWRKLTVMVRRKIGNRNGPAEEKPAPAMWVYFARLKELKKQRPNDAAILKRWKEVRDFIFSLHWDDAERIANTYLSKNMPRYSLLESDDLKQGAAKGLLGCIDTYDINVGTDFMQYANAKKSRLRGAVIDSLRELQNCTRLIAKQRRELRPLFAKLTQKLRRPPSIEDFLEHYGKVSEDGKLNYKEILTDPLYWSGVFNQSRKGLFSSTEGGDASEEFATDTEDTRPVGACGMERGDFFKRVLSVVKDPKANFAIWAYHLAGMTNDQISQHLSCSPSVAAAKHKEGLKIIEANFTVEEFKAMMEIE